eukprot:TRINITY_DN33339_c0_g1_i1.p1 TRINITY_DN33339_c0_g1~~TRINITY_DN33339_c0_g1_i1.p1  ORF type:complete len:400 (-),score=62.58 TRINITY_DN33339_c0_g1_i1:306-1505(-)
MKVSVCAGFCLFSLSSVPAGASPPAARSGGNTSDSSGYLRYPSFEDYVKRFGKSYEPKDYAQHKEIYERRILRIMEHNSKPERTWTEGVNKFTDTAAPKAKYMPRRKQQMEIEDSAITTALPAHVDWKVRRPPVITPALDQGDCGDCWAISATKAVESHLAITTGELLKLSTQHIADCASQGNGKHDCNFGGYIDDAFRHVKKKGIPLAEHYPRLNKGAECDWSVAPAAGVRGHRMAHSNDAHAFMRALLTGPVSVSVDASWDSYHRGVFSGCSKVRSALSHQVLLAGYAQENGKKYWLVQNSWGTDWGEDGYIRLKRYNHEPCVVDADDHAFRNCGECGLLAEGAYPTGAFKHSRGLQEKSAMDEFVLSGSFCQFMLSPHLLIVSSLLALHQLCPRCT